MIATLYNRGQMVIPAKARRQARLVQGDVLDVRIEGDGKILLVRLERPKEPAGVKAKIIQRKGRHPVGDIGRPIDPQAVLEAIRSFPP